MQKKLIALAVAALASGAAFAQSNVTVYGQVDVGVTSLTQAQNIDSSTGKKFKSKFAVNSSQSDASKLGFTGIEDLGNGTKALFKLEAGFHVDDGSLTNDVFFNEQAFVGFTGGWGTAIAGRLVAPRYGFLAALDPFGDGTVARFGNVYNDLIFANVDRVNNGIAYVSPAFSGFTVTAAYATNALSQEGSVGDALDGVVGVLGVSTPLGYVGANNLDAETYTFLPRYTSGPLDVGLAWQNVKLQKANKVIGTNVKLSNVTLGVSYDFQAVKLSFALDSYSNKLSSITGASGSAFKQKANTWMLGLSIPFGNSAVQVSYNQSKLDDKKGFTGEKLDTTQYGFGFTHNLSKRTNVYAAYAKIKNKEKNGVSRGAALGDAYNVYDHEAYRNGLQLGVKHQF